MLRKKVKVSLTEEEVEMLNALRGEYGENVEEIIKAAIFIAYGLHVLFKRGGYLEIVEPENEEEESCVE